MRTYKKYLAMGMFCCCGSLMCMDEGQPVTDAPFGGSENFLPATAELEQSPVTEPMAPADSAGQVSAAAEGSEGPVPQEEVEIATPDRPSEMQGIDTLEIDEAGGNWLVKRMWWEKAEEKMSRIEAALVAITGARAAFYEKRDQLDTALFEPFYNEMGLDQGQLEEIISVLLQELQEKREKEVALDKDALEFRRTLEQERQVLESLNGEVAGVRKMDDAVSEALDKLVEQIKLTKKYREEAQHYFSEIAKVLDHEKAREYYYRLDADWQNIKSIQEYIAGKFTEYFEQLSKNAQEQTAHIKGVMNELEKRGLSLKDQYMKRQNVDQSKEEQRRRLAEKLAQEEAAQQGGFLSSVWSVLTAPFKMVWGWLSAFGSWVSSLWSGSSDEGALESSEGQVQEQGSAVPTAEPVQAQQALDEQKDVQQPEQSVENLQQEAVAQSEIAPAPSRFPGRVETRPIMGQQSSQALQSQEQVSPSPAAPAQEAMLPQTDAQMLEEAPVEAAAPGQ